MDFELNEQQKMVRQLARDFLEREVVPIIRLLKTVNAIGESPVR